MTRDNGDYRTQQTQNAIKFVNEKFNLFYSESKIILQIKKTNEVLRYELDLFNPKEILNSIDPSITCDDSNFCVDSNKSRWWAIEDQNPIKFTSDSKA